MVDTTDLNPSVSERRPRRDRWPTHRLSWQLIESQTPDRSSRRSTTTMPRLGWLIYRPVDQIWTRCRCYAVSETTRLLVGEVPKNIVGTLVEEIVVQTPQCLTNNKRSACSRPSSCAQNLSQTISDRHFLVIQADGQKAIASPASNAIRAF